MEIRCYQRIGRCIIRPLGAATRPNNANGDALWTELEVAYLRLQAVKKAPFARSDLEQFILDLIRFDTDRTGEARLQTTRFVYAGVPLPFMDGSPMEMSPGTEVTLRIYALGLARHVALEARVTVYRTLYSTQVEDSLVVTFELDPSTLAGYAAELENDLAQF